MRKFILDTRSHHCAMVDGLSQNRRKHYRWLPEMLTERAELKWNFTESWDSAEGIYREGFGEENIDVIHKRKIIFVKNGLPSLKPFAIVCDRLFSNDGNPHSFEISYQMDVHPYTASSNTFTADMGDGVSMSIFSSVPSEIIVGQKEPVYLGWRPIRSPIEHEHAPAPCLRYIREGLQARVITVLYPSNGEIALQSVIASTDPADTEIRLQLCDGNTLLIREDDYPCFENAPEAPQTRF